MKFLFCLYTLVLHCLLIISPTPCRAESQAPAAEKVRIGAILPLTGPASAIGNGFRDAIELAREKLPKELNERIEIYYEDDGFSAKTAVTAFNHLVDTKNINLLINAGSSTGHALAPLAEQRKITFFSVASDGRISAGRKHVFNFWVTPEEEVAAMLPEVLRRSYKRVARISTMHDGPIAVNKSFDSLNHGRVQVVLDEYYPGEERDFKIYIAKLRGQHADAIMVELLPGQCGVFAKQVRQAGINADMFAIEVFEDPNEVKASEGALIGQWYINADEGDALINQEFRRRFPASSSWGALNAYDAIMLTAAALKGGYKTEDLPIYLHTLKDFKGALGTYSATGDNRFSLPATVKVVKPDGFEKLTKTAFK